MANGHVVSRGHEKLFDLIPNVWLDKNCVDLGGKENISKDGRHLKCLTFIEPKHFWPIFVNTNNMISTTEIQGNALKYVKRLDDLIV